MNNENGLTFTLPLEITLTQQELDNLPEDITFSQMLNLLHVKLYTDIKNGGIEELRDRVNCLSPEFTNTGEIINEFLYEGEE